jgi:hypothetical protein
MHLGTLDWRGGYAPKLVAAAALVALGDWLFFQHQRYGGAFGLFGIAMIAALVLARPAVRGDLRARALAGLAVLYGAAMAYDANMLAWCLFWIAAGMATLIPATGRFDDGWRWFQRLFFHGFTSLFGPLIDFYKLSRARRGRKATRFGLRASLPVLVLPVVGSGVILLLFASANPLIEQALTAITPPDFSIENVARLALWSVLFILTLGLLRPRLPRRLLGTFDGRGDLRLPGVSLASVTLSLIAFNTLFALQNSLDIAYLWGMVPLPEGMTLAAYAHRGAYPLILTALLAGLFVLVVLRPGSQTAETPLVRRLVMLWIAQNVFLVGSSILRTLDYVEAYSLTVLRLSALLWMGLVAVGLVLVGWRMLRGHSAGWLINANLAAAGVLLTGVCFVDLGAVAANWNVRHAREIDGKGAMLDLCYLNRLGGSSLLPLIDLEQRPLPAELHQRVHNVRAGVHQRLLEEVTQGGWTWLGEQRLTAAAQRLGGKLDLPQDDRGFMCDGGAFPPPPPVADAAQPAVAATMPTAPDSPTLTRETER